MAFAGHSDVFQVQWSLLFRAAYLRLSMMRGHCAALMTNSSPQLASSSALCSAADICPTVGGVRSLVIYNVGNNLRTEIDNLVRFTSKIVTESDADLQEGRYGVRPADRQEEQFGGRFQDRVGRRTEQGRGYRRGWHHYRRLRLRLGADRSVHHLTDNRRAQQGTRLERLLC